MVFSGFLSWKHWASRGIQPLDYKDQSKQDLGEGEKWEGRQIRVIQGPTCSWIGSRLLQEWHLPWFPRCALGGWLRILIHSIPSPLSPKHRVTSFCPFSLCPPSATIASSCWNYSSDFHVTSLWMLRLEKHRYGWKYTTWIKFKIGWFNRSRGGEFVNKHRTELVFTLNCMESIQNMWLSSSQCEFLFSPVVFLTKLLCLKTFLSDFRKKWGL